MSVFIDTAAFLAVLNVDDEYHAPACHAWNELLFSDAILFTSNYVLLETTALLQYRFGMEAVRLFQNDILPVVEAVWVDETIHAQALSALLVANRRRLSLVDCSSFELMHRFGLESAFTFDPHFREQGFRIVPDLTES